jgi:hypothetical protein
MEEISLPISRRLIHDGRTDEHDIVMKVDDDYDDNNIVPWSRVLL